MNTSPEIKELAAALVAAQKQISHAARLAEAAIGKEGSRRYRYADLASIWDACRGPLTEAGLAITQTTRVEAGAPLLVTRLMHTSGQWVDSETPILAKASDPQAFGSAMTYARRYALSAIVGVAAEDDDGQAATNRPAVQQQRQAPAVAANDANVDPAHAALAAEFKRRIGDLPELSAFGDLVRDLDAAGLPQLLLDDVRAEVVVVGVRFAVEQEDLDAWVPKLQAWKLSSAARDRAAAAWEKRSDELAAQKSGAAA